MKNSLKSKISGETDKEFFFFIGTIAELIKVVPVILEFEKKKLSFRIIASGQNDLQMSELWKRISRNDTIFLSQEKIFPTALGLIWWWSKVLPTGYLTLRQLLAASTKRKFFVVHGDTVSTVMGALLGRLLGAKVIHLEAGLRSFDYFHPFPEEIDRVLTSRLASYHCCPNAWAMKNLSHLPGQKINTTHNTLLDSLAIAVAAPPSKAFPQRVHDMMKKKTPYFVFVMHRQENLANEAFVRAVWQEISTASEKISCFFILHTLTQVAFEQYELLSSIPPTAKIHPLPRLPYVDMMKLLNSAQFIITDGGSNQEEAYYLGKPCLVLRKVTERTEGLGENVVLAGIDATTIPNFISNYHYYQTPSIHSKVSPSQIIAKFSSSL